MSNKLQKIKRRDRLRLMEFRLMGWGPHRHADHVGHHGVTIFVIKEGPRALISSRFVKSPRRTGTLSAFAARPTKGDRFERDLGYVLSVLAKNIENYDRPHGSRRTAEKIDQLLRMVAQMRTPPAEALLAVPAVPPGDDGADFDADPSLMY